MSAIEVLAALGYKHNPLDGALMETADVVRTRRIMSLAVKQRAMVSLVGARGFGKTTAIQAALEDVDAFVVTLQTPDKDRIVISDIEKALIMNLSEAMTGTVEPCKRTKEVRARQIRRILGEASDVKPVILVLEEAHRMFGQTLRSLKTFREMTWKGNAPLFTVIMVGQYDPLKKRHVDEVRLRSSSVTMKGLTDREVLAYVDATVGDRFEASAVVALARLDGSRMYLDLQEILINLMASALQRGKKLVTPFEVFDLYGGGLKELMKARGLTNADIQKKTGLAKSTVSMVLSGKTGGMNSDTVTDAREAIAGALSLDGKSVGGLKAVGGGANHE
jgi:type II secretory pathway predicted ATPase ExeA